MLFHAVDKCDCRCNILQELDFKSLILFEVPIVFFTSKKIMRVIIYNFLHIIYSVGH